MAASDPHFRLRVPEDLHARLKQEADVNGRTINAEIVYRLRSSFTQEPSKAAQVQDLIKNIRAEIGYVDHKIQTDQADRARLQQMLVEAIEAQIAVEKNEGEVTASTSSK